jgi:hypothetical protein
MRGSSDLLRIFNVTPKTIPSPFLLAAYIPKKIPFGGDKD